METFAVEKVAGGLDRSGCKGGDEKRFDVGCIFIGNVVLPNSQN